MTTSAVRDLRVTDALFTIDAIEKAAERAAQACRKEMELEDERSVLKPVATRRIMEREKLAATPAEKLVETDEEYAALRRKQYDAVVEKQRAFGALRAAELRARLQVALVEVR